MSNIIYKCLLLFTAGSLTIGAAVAQEGKYQLDGDIDGLGQQKVYLNTRYNGVSKIDSVDAKDGKFSFKGTVPDMLVFWLKFGDGKSLVLPIAVNEHVKVKGKLGQLENASITGAKNLPIWKEWSKGWSLISSRGNALYRKLDSAGKAGNAADKKNAEQELKTLNLRLVDSVEVIVKKYPASPLVAYLIIDRFVNYPNPEKAQSTYAALAPAAKNSTYGKELGHSVSLSSRTGLGVYPQFTLPDKDGKPVSLASLKGKVVLVDFWASWCGPCRKENPNLVKAYEKYHDKGFDIIGISLDVKKDAWLKAIETDHLNWVHVSDLKGWKADLVTEYGIRSIPMSFLVNADGKIIAKDLRGEDLEKQLEIILK